MPSGFASGSATLSASTVYYAYVICASSPAIFLSTVAPSTDGHPSSNLADANDCGTNSADTHGVFIGSILTDSSKNVIPFARMGDEVLLEVSTSPTGSQGLQSLGYNVTTGNIGVCNGSSTPFSFSEYPESASGMIADVFVNLSAYNTNAFAILVSSTASSCSSTAWNAEWVSYQPLTYEHERMTIKPSQSCTTSTCTAGVYFAQGSGDSNGDYFQVNYVGYVEKIQMLNFF